MRSRLLSLTLIAVLFTVVLAGCGGSSGSKLSDAVKDELSYFPSGSPLVLTVATDPNSNAIKNAQALEGQFPLAAFGQTALKNRLQQAGINYQNDVRPLFGNPVMFGVTSNTISRSTSSNQFVFAWVTKDEGKLKSLLKKLGGLQQTGSQDGATLYDSGGAAVAVAGATVLISGDQTVLKAALDRHSHSGQGISTSDYERETSGLSSDSLVQIFGNLSTVLSSSSAANARRVPWVAALRGYGVAINATGSGLGMKFHLDTSGTKLSASQLPFAAGSATPGLAGVSPITAGIHDPAQIFSFIESATQQANPAGYANFQKEVADARAKSGVDFNAFLKLFTGDLIVGSDTRTTIGRVSVSDAAAASHDLAGLAAAMNRTHRNQVTTLPGGFYAVHNHRTPINVGVVGNQLVAGNAPPAKLRTYATSPATPASGAHGTVAFRVQLDQLLANVLGQGMPSAARSVLGQIGDLNGWASSSPSGVDGSASIGIK